MTSSKGSSAPPGRSTHQRQRPTCVPSCATTLQKFSRSCSRHCSSSRLWSITLQAGGGQQRGDAVGEDSEGWTPREPGDGPQTQTCSQQLSFSTPPVPHATPPCLNKGPPASRWRRMAGSTGASLASSSAAERSARSAPQRTRRAVGRRASRAGGQARMQHHRHS